MTRNVSNWLSDWSIKVVQLSSDRCLQRSSSLEICLTEGRLLILVQERMFSTVCKRPFVLFSWERVFFHPMLLGTGPKLNFSCLWCLPTWTNIFFSNGFYYVLEFLAVKQSNHESIENWSEFFYFNKNVW
jgi:hypothetical protein